MGIIFNLPIKKKRVIQTLVFIIMAFLEHSHQFVKKNLSILSYEPKVLFIYFTYSLFKIQTLVFIIMVFLEHSHQFVKKKKKKIYLLYHMNLSFFFYFFFYFLYFTNLFFKILHILLSTQLG